MNLKLLSTHGIVLGAFGGTSGGAGGAAADQDVGRARAPVRGCERRRWYAATSTVTGR
jgi:hypothetical protein